MSEPLVLVVVDPGDPAAVPWRPGCPTCAVLAAEPRPGLGSWSTSVGRHFAYAHRVALLTP